MKKTGGEGMLQLSDHFSSNEFACKCGCGEKEVNPESIKVLELIHRTVNRPSTIISGRRCEKHNAAVGGAKHSQHVLGNQRILKFGRCLQMKYIQ